MRKLILTMLCLVAVTAPSVQAAQQPLSDTQIEQIRRNCRTAQSYLQRIQRNDAAARINRGRAYESMSKLLANFNSRVVLNKLDAPLLVTTTSDISKRISDFQADYLLYDDALTSTLKVECRDQPVTFYDALTRAREARAKLAKDVQDINQLLDGYQQGLTELRAGLAAPTKTETAQ